MHALATRTARRLAVDPRVTDADREAILGPGGLGMSIARSMRRAVVAGYIGHLDDNVAEATDWGFRVGDIRAPVVVRHGVEDRFVSVAQGRWLVDAIPGARGVFPSEGRHMSILLPWEEVVGQLVEAAR